MSKLTAAGRRDLLTDRNAGLLLFFVTLVFTSIYALQLNIPPVLDEVGTMANTAAMVGYDWTECVASMGRFYYKYGMSILYYPFFLLIRDSYVLYKAIMVLHSIMLSFIPVFAYIIYRKHLKIESITNAAMLSLAGSLLPSVLLYALYARGDMLLIFLPWPTLLCMFEAYQAGIEGKKRRQIVFSALTGFLAVYAYMGHTRGLVAIIAVFMTVGLIQLVLKQKVVRWIPYLSTTVIFLVIDKFVAGWFKAVVYGPGGTRHASAESFDFEYLKLIFTKDGFLSLVKVALGWVFNVLASTYGLVGIGLLAALLIMLAVLRKKYNITPKELILALFAALSFLGTFAMGCLFFFPTSHKYYIGEQIERADRLVYGRYTVSSVGLLVLIALYVLVVRRDVFKLRGKLAVVGTYIITLVLFVWKAAPYLTLASSNSRYFISLTTFLKLEAEGKTVDNFPNIVEALGYAGLLGLGILTVILIITAKNRKWSRTALCLVLLASSLTIYTVDYNKIRLGRDEVLVKYIDEPTSLLEEISEVAEEFPIVLWDKASKAKDIKHYQFVCKEYTVGSYKTAAADAENCFILGHKNYYLEKYFDDDYYTFACFDYENAARDIVYVKGEALKDKLESMGYEMVKYTGELR